ncbi:MAG: lipopolysaccharide kinase InaA family protein [Kiritimatiellales bacterium]
MKVILYSEKGRTFVEAAVRQALSVCRSSVGGWPDGNVSGFRTLNKGGRAGVAAVTVDGRTCCVKVFYDGRRLVKLRNRLGLSKARRAFRNGVELARRGVGCPAMLGYVVDPESGFALLVTELSKHVRMDRWIEHNGAAPEAAQALGFFIRQMHDAGVTHKDLSLRNLLVRETAGVYDFLLLDYEDTRFFSAVSEKQRLDNLHHLHERVIAAVPENIRRVFLAAYLNDENLADPWCEKLNKLIAAHPSKYTQATEGESDV